MPFLIKIMLSVTVNLWAVAHAFGPTPLSKNNNHCTTRRASSHHKAIGNDYLSTLSLPPPPPSSSSSPQENSLVSLAAPIISTSDQEGRSVSLEGVPYALVSSGIDLLYPPEEESQRNALSRTDGYWPFLHKGEEPPMELTYGEFELDFFANLLDRAHAHYMADPRNNKEQDDWTGKTFVDIGSGTGRLVFAAAALHPSWQCSHGIELLPKINQVAQDHLDTLLLLTQQNDNDNTSFNTPKLPIPNNLASLPMSPVQCTCGSFDDPAIATPILANADVVFFFSTCIPEHILDDFAKSVGQRCRPGTIVITTEYPLSLEGLVVKENHDGQNDDGGFYRLSLLEEIDGVCHLIGGTSTAFVHKVEESVWTPNLATASSYAQ